MISTHTPLAGRDQNDNEILQYPQISTHTPLAGRDRKFTRFLAVCNISTHTPLAGRDLFLSLCRLFFQYFNSHAPRGA